MCTLCYIPRLKVLYACSVYINYKTCAAWPVCGSLSIVYEQLIGNISFNDSTRAKLSKLTMHAVITYFLLWKQLARTSTHTSHCVTWIITWHNSCWLAPKSKGGWNIGQLIYTSLVPRPPCCKTNNKSNKEEHACYLMCMHGSPNLIVRAIKNGWVVDRGLVSLDRLTQAWGAARYIP